MTAPDRAQGLYFISVEATLFADRNGIVEGVEQPGRTAAAQVDLRPAGPERSGQDRWPGLFSK